jgi:hypothetical protein
LQRHLSPSAFLLTFVAPIGALRIIAFGDFPAGVDMRRSGALYQVINRKERRRAEARLLSPDQRRDFDEARRLGKSRLGAEDLVRTHHIEPCADASGP